MRYAFLLGLMLLAQPAQASFLCSCELVSKKWLEESAGVLFEGNVTKAIEVSGGDNFTLNITSIIRGLDDGTSTIELNLAGHCGFHFKEGRIYKIAAFFNDGVLGSSACDITSLNPN